MFCYSIKENIMFDKNIDNKKLEKVLNCLNLNDLIAEVGIHTNYTKRFDENFIKRCMRAKQNIINRSKLE